MKGYFAQLLTNDSWGSTIQGSIVRNLLVEEKLNIAEQFYASVAIDRRARRYIVLASSEGGVDIEQVAEASPEKISRHWIDPILGFSEHAAESMLAQFSNINQDDVTKFASSIHTLYKGLSW